jgi:hypothetical protein
MSSAIDIRNHLTELQAERALANAEGRFELDEQIVAVTRAYVGAAVTEIAVLRAELSGPQVG